MSPNLDLLSTSDAVMINDVSVEGVSAAYHITVQQCATHSTVEHRCQHVSHIIKNFFTSLPQEPKLLKLNTFTVMSACVTDLGYIGQCYLTFRLVKKYFTDKFIVL